MSKNMHAIDFLKFHDLHDVMLTKPFSSKPALSASETLVLYTEHLQNELTDQKIWSEDLLTAILETIENNLELTVGDDCKLAKLKHILYFYVAERENPRQL